jgi:hypothetical protein
LSTGRKRIKYAIWWTLLGVLSFVAAWGQHALGFGTILLTISGLWWICAGTTNFFPIRHLRHTYRGLKLSGKKFHAHVNEEGFEVVGASRPAKRDSKRLLSASAPLKLRATPSRPAGAGL